MLEEFALPLPQTSASPATVAEIDVPALVQAHATTLFRVAHSLLRNRAEAEDTVQDTFVRVLQHRRALPDLQDVRPWLIRIAWNLALDRRRRVRRAPTDQADELFLQALVTRETPADQVLHEAEQTRRVLQAIDRLLEAERQALLLTAVEELSTAEVAVVMGKTESAVRALVHRARTRLRERLAERLPKGGKR